MKNIKGFIKPKKEEKPAGLAESLLGTAELFNKLQTTKEEVAKVVDAKIKEADDVIRETKQVVDEGKKKIDEKVAEFEQTAIGLIEDIHKIPQIQGEKGKDAEEVDVKKLADEVFARVPKPDEKALVKRVIAMIPESKADLKIIKETFEIDPMTVVSKILSLKPEEFQLTTAHIDGLEKTLKNLSLNSGKGYVHGGGFNNIYSSSTLVSNGLTGLNFTGAGVSSVTKDSATGIITVDITGGGASGLTVGTTTITSGTTTRILYDNAGVLGEYTISGSGTSVAMSTAPTFATSITASYATASTIAIFDGSKNLISADTATYPSLTELSYVKGVTSAIQTQLNAKQGTITLTTTGTSGAATLVGDTLNIPQYAASITGSDTQVLFFDGANNPAGDAGFTYTKATDTLNIVGGINLGGTATTESNLSWSTVQTVDTTVLALGSTSRGLVIVENGDTGFDFAHAQATNPSLFIHSAAQSTTQWTGLWHDGTNAILTAGTGDLYLNGATKTVDNLDFGGVNGTVSISNAGISGIILQSFNTGATAIWGALASRIQIAATSGTVNIGNQTGTNKTLIVNNGTSTGNILEVQDNGTAVFTVADGGTMTAATNTFTISGSSAVLTVGAGNNLVASSSSFALAHAVAATNTMSSTLTSVCNTTGTAAAGFGNSIKFLLESSTTNSQDAGAIGFIWTDATHATRSSAAIFQTVTNAGSLATGMRLAGEVLSLVGSSTQAGELRFYEDTDSGTNYTSFKAGVQAGDIVYTLPTAIGGAGEVLTDVAGDGVLSWEPAGGGSVSFGTAGQIPVTNATTDDFDYYATFYTTDGNTISIGAEGSSGVLSGVAATTADTAGGGLDLWAANGLGTGEGGYTTIKSGIGGATGAGGIIAITAGRGGATSGAGGDITITAGNGFAGNSDGGDITLQSGNKAGSGVLGDITLSSAGLVYLGSGGNTDNSVRLVGTTANAIFDTSSITTDKTFTFPDATGTIALTSDIPAAGANTALSNLASVAINTTLVSDTDNTDALGTTAIAWSDLFLGSGAVITFNSAPSTADVTITHSSNLLTIAGGDLALDGIKAGTTSSGILLKNNDGVTVASFGVGSAASTNIALSGSVALGANNLTMTGSLAATGSRVTKGWFTDIESTNMPTVGGTSIASTFAPIASPTFTGTVTLPTTSLSGVMTMAENAAIAYDPSLSADGKYCGDTVTGTAGATLAFGDLVYLAAADSRWELVDADAVGTCGTVLIGMCVLAAAADGDATNILLRGFIRADTAFPALTISAPVYAGETAGDVQTTIPTGADSIIRVLGNALTADSMYFNPSQEWQVNVA